jgi:hypothetical protein
MSIHNISKKVVDAYNNIKEQAFLDRVRLQLEDISKKILSYNPTAKEVLAEEMAVASFAPLETRYRTMVESSTVLSEDAKAREIQFLDELSKETLKKYKNKAEYDKSNKEKASVDAGKAFSRSIKSGDVDGMKNNAAKAQKADDKAEKRKAGIATAKKKLKEDVEQIDEKSKFMKRADGSIPAKKDEKKPYPNEPWRGKLSDLHGKGKKVKEDVEQIDELSNKTLKSYKEKATDKHKQWSDQAVKSNDDYEKAQSKMGGDLYDIISALSMSTTANKIVKKRGKGLAMVNKKLKEETILEFDASKFASLGRAGLFDMKNLPKLKKALSKEDAKLTRAEKDMMIGLLDSMMGLLSNQSVYSKVKQSLQKEEAINPKLVNLGRAGLFDLKTLPKLKRALSKEGEDLTLSDKSTLLSLLDSLMSQLTDLGVYNKLKQSLATEDIISELGALKEKSKMVIKEG